MPWGENDQPVTTIEQLGPDFTRTLPSVAGAGGYRREAHEWDIFQDENAPPILRQAAANAIRAQNAEPDGTDVLRSLPLPGVGHIVGSIVNSTRAAAQKRIDAGKGTEDDYWRVAGAARDAAIAQRLSQSQANMPWYMPNPAGVGRTTAFMMELYGLAPAAKAASALAGGGIAGTGAAITTEALGSGLALEAATQRAAPWVDAQGQTQAGLPIGQAALSGFADAMIEVGVERAGEHFAKILPKAVRERATRLWQRYIKVNPQGSTAEFGRLLKNTHFDGLLSEVGEERLGEVLTGVKDVAFGDQRADFGATGDILSGNPQRQRQGLRQIGQEAATFAPLSIAGGIANVADNRARGQQLDQIREARAAWSSPEIAQQTVDALLARGHSPEKIRELANNPSNTAFEAYGLGSRKFQTMPGAGSRRAFGENALKYLDSIAPAEQSPEASQGAVDQSPVVNEQPAPAQQPEVTFTGDVTQPQPGILGFTTAKGSTYEVDDQGRTTRSKSLHTGHDPNDVGVKQRSDQTFYIAPEDARRIGMWQTSSAQGKRTVIQGDEALLVSINPQTGKHGLDERIKLHRSPAVGLSPLELWDRSSKGWWRALHPGSPITELRTHSPVPVAPRGESKYEMIPPAPSEQAPQPAPAPSEPAQPETPVPSPYTGTGFRGFGRTDRGAVYGEGAAGPIFGAADYLAPNPDIAKQYGPEIEQVPISLAKPYVVDSDAALTKLLGRKIPLDNETRSQIFPKARQRLEKAGYDGIVVNVPQGDMNDRGEPAKRLIEIFGHSQVVSFKPQANRQPVTPVEPPRPTYSPQQSKPAVAGNATTITAGDQQYPAQYALMELADLTPSHDFWRGSPADNVAEGRYPQSLQPRGYRDIAEATKVRDRSEAEQAHFFLEDTQRADGGPPSVSPDGIVFNGNGRTMMLQMAAGEQRYGWYRDALEKKAAGFGIDPSTVAAMKQPVLVRVVNLDPTSQQAATFAAQGNVTATQAQSPIRTAAALSKLVDADLLNSIPVPDDATFSDVVGSGRVGRDFRELIRKSLPPSVVPNYFDGEGNLTDTGKDLVRDMLLAKILPVETVERFIANRKALAGAIEKALPVLLRMAKAHGELFAAFQNAAEFLAEKPDVRTVPDLRTELDQGVMFGEKRPMNSASKMLAAFMLRASGKPRVFAGKLGRLMNDLEVTGKGGLFGGETTANKPIDIAADALDVEPIGKEFYAGRTPGQLNATAAPPGPAGTGAAASWSRSPAETPKGRALVKAIENDSTTKPAVGIRSISEFLINGMHSALIVTSGQVTSKHPAHFKAGGTAVIMAATGAFGLNYHEGAHALSAWLKDTHGNWYRKVSGALKAFSEVAPHASAKSAEEGLAEVGRYYIVDQSKIPPRLLAAFESILSQKNPEALAIMRDAHRAHQALVSKPIDQFLMALNNDRGPKASYLQSASTWLYGMLDFFVGNAVTVDYAERKAFNTLFTAEKRNSSRRAALAKARDFRRSLVDTPGSVRAAYHARLQATGGAVRALGGEGDVQGIRVRLWGKFQAKGGGRFDTSDTKAGFARFSAETLDAMREAGFEIPEDAESRHGHDLTLFGASVQQIRDVVGEQDWPAFSMWKQYQVALERWRKTDSSFPGMWEGKLDEIKRFVKEGAKKPKWAQASKLLDRFFRQMLLMNVLSGQTMPAEAIRIATSYEHYAPLYRVQEEFDQPGYGSQRGRPTGPLRRQFGSLRQFENLDDNINQYVRQTFAAYYDQMVIDSVLYESRLAGADKSLPYEFRTTMERTLVPLHLEKTKAATALGPELAPAVADAINRMKLKDVFGINPNGLDWKEVANELEKQGGEPIFADDINVHIPGLPIYRNTSPRQHRVVARWEKGEREYYLVTDPVIYNLFSTGRLAGQDSAFLKLLSRTLNGLTQPWKRAITHSPKFAVRSLVRDPWAGLWLGQTLFNRKGTAKRTATTTAEDLLPGASLAVGTLQQLFPGSLDIDAKAAQELARKSLDFLGTETFGKAWRSPWDVAASFSPAELARTGWEVFKEGIAPPASWNTASTAEKMADLPGMAMSAALKPIDIAWWLIGSRRFASWQETTPRVRAWQRAAEEGLSPAESQVAFDSITGLFAARPSNDMLWNFYRAAGFVNPFLQTAWQNVSLVTHPDPQIRNHALLVRLPYFTILGAGAAALMFLLRSASNGDDDKWKKTIVEQSEKERLTHFDLWGLRLPFPHGIEGAVFSAGYNLVLDSLLKNPVDGKDRAQRLIVQAADPVGIEDFTSPHLRTSFELAKDWSYHLEKTIVPATLRERYPDNPEKWVRPDTPEVYRAIASGANVSPLQVQYAVRNGIAAQYDDLLTWLGGNGKNPATKGLTYDPVRYWHSRSVEQLERLDKQYNAIHQELAKRAPKDPAAAEQLQRLEVAHRVNLEVDRLIGELQEASGDEAKALEAQVIEVARHYLTTGGLHPAIADHAALAELKALKRNVKLGENESADSFEARAGENQYRQERAMRLLNAGS